MLTTAQEQSPLPEATSLRRRKQRTLDLYPLANSPASEPGEIHSPGRLTWSPGGARAMVDRASRSLWAQSPYAVFRESYCTPCLALGSLPYLYVIYTRREAGRLREQFRALDFLARSMRAGHAFSVSLEMLADESPDPLGIEFRQVFNEQNFGAPRKLPCATSLSGSLSGCGFLRFCRFAQRETGAPVRNPHKLLCHPWRFRLKVRFGLVSAHGRINRLSSCDARHHHLCSCVAPQYLTAWRGFGWKNIDRRRHLAQFAGIFG